MNHDLDEFGLNWKKIPFEREEGIKGIWQVFEKTQERLNNLDNEEKRDQFKTNALELVSLIISQCTCNIWREIEASGEFDSNLDLDEKWRGLKNFFAFAKVNIENKKPFYLL